MNYLVSIIIGVFVAVGGFFAGHVQAPQAPVSFGSYSPTGGGTYRTGQSIGTSDTTLKLSSFKEPVSGIPYTMSYLGSDIEYITISPQSSISEFASFSGITQNSDGSATLTGLVRGLSRTPGTGGCVASTTLAQSHAGQSIVILSNPPCQLAEYMPLRTIATSTAAEVITSTSPWHYDFNPTWASVSSTTFASKGYVDTTAAAGAAPITTSVAGIGILATAAQAAASTATGVFNAITYNLLLPSSIATTTPSVETKNVIPVTGTNQKLAQAFLDLTQAFSWSGLHTFTAGLLATASSTFIATTSIAANSVTANPFKLNGLAYAFQGTRAASSTILSENGSGSLSWNTVSAISGAFFLGATTTGASTVGQTTVEKQVMQGITLPANTMSTSGAIDLRLFFSPYNDPGGNTTGTFKVKFGGAVVCTAQLAAAPTGGGSGWIDFIILSNASASAQICIMQSQYGGASGGYINYSAIDSNGTVNTATSQAITVTFQWTDQTDANVLTLTSAYATALGHQ